MLALGAVESGTRRFERKGKLNVWSRKRHWRKENRGSVVHAVQRGFMF
jgi:hypothetical protein